MFNTLEEIPKHFGVEAKDIYVRHCEVRMDSSYAGEQHITIELIVPSRPPATPKRAPSMPPRVAEELEVWEEPGS